MSETQADPQVTGQMFLFRKPELMAKEQHGDLGVSKPDQRYAFCAKVRAIPINVTEIPAAARDYPIIFMSKEQPIPLAVVGIIDDLNLFVGDDGEWEKFRYVPAYVRRYPFGVANETGGTRMAVIIDTEYEGFGKSAEFPLFENGEPTKFTSDAVEFCKVFEQERQLTDDFTKRLAPYDVIQPQAGQYTPNDGGDPKPFAEYFAVDENKLKELTDQQVAELHKTNFLPVLYAMLTSMANWRTLLQRRADRFGLTEGQLMDTAKIN